MVICSSRDISDCSYSCCDRKGDCPACSADCYRYSSSSYTSRSYTSQCSGISITSSGLSTPVLINIIFWSVFAVIVGVVTFVIYRIKKNQAEAFEAQAEVNNQGYSQGQFNPTEGCEQYPNQYQPGYDPNQYQPGYDPNQYQYQQPGQYQDPTQYQYQQPQAYPQQYPYQGPAPAVIINHG